MPSLQGSDIRFHFLQWSFAFNNWSHCNRQISFPVPAFKIHSISDFSENSFRSVCCLDDIILTRHTRDINGIKCYNQHLRNGVGYFYSLDRLLENLIYTIALHHQNQICVQDGQQNQICRLTHFSRAKRMAMKTSSLFFVLVICDAPSIVICPMFEYSKTPSTLLTLFFYVSSFLFISNTCLNPLVICCKIREVPDFFCKCLQKRVFKMFSFR